MRNLLGFIVGVIVFFVLIFVVDKAIVNAIVGALPASAEEWKGIIKIACWFFILWLTLGLAFVVSTIVGTIATALFGGTIKRSTRTKSNFRR